MVLLSELLEIHPAAHPKPVVQSTGFLLDDPYLEQCWGGVIGPSAVAFLRHCMWHWQDEVPARVRIPDFAGELGLGRGVGPNSPLWHTIGRLLHFRLVAAGEDRYELRVFTRVPALSQAQLYRLPGWVQERHQRLVGRHRLALEAAGGEPEPPAQNRGTASLSLLTGQQKPKARRLGR
ncbi:MAG TPA: hypothetical protein VFJ85_16940 [Acidimicrobiales bacterium]|nr:hypothetical protein [Acidimicrobiales bacterium]